VSPRSRWCPGRSKLRTWVDASRVADDRFEIDVGAILHRQPRMERGGWLTAGFAHFLGFQRTLDDVRDRASFPPGETVGEITRAGAADG